MLRSTWRGLETWHGRDAVTPRNRKGETTGNTNFDLHRRASPRPYLGAPGGEIPPGDSTFASDRHAPTLAPCPLFSGCCQIWGTRRTVVECIDRRWRGASRSQPERSFASAKALNQRPLIRFGLPICNDGIDDLPQLAAKPGDHVGAGWIRGLVDPFIRI